MKTCGTCSFGKKSPHIKDWQRVCQAGYSIYKDKDVDQEACMQYEKVADPEKASLGFCGNGLGGEE